MRTLLLCAFTGLAACRTMPPAASLAPETRVVQPGAPGQPTRVFAEPAVGAPAFTEADVRFMQGMIAHHAQALEMTALVAERTDRRDLHLLAQRIDVSQHDEIRLMQTWLRDRGQTVPEATSHGHHAAGLHGMMPGMLSSDQMRRLAESTGDTFYRLFLEFMISHHEGALTMVEQLFASDGAGQETGLYTFAADVDIDQRMEIERMRQMLASSP
jgi:uncharacterized protein (DUF305 family)